MSKRMELIAPKKYEQNGEQKVYWMKLGSAFQNQDGETWTLVLDTIPLGPGWDGRIQMRPPRDNNEARGSSASHDRQRSNTNRNSNQDRGGF